MPEKNNKTTILLVDDKEANIFALQKLLEKQERTILTALCGRDALQIALAGTVDLIVLDVQMPELDGFEVAQILKSNKKTKDIPIIFATAERKEHQFIMKGFEEGAVDYLFKPLDAEITKAKVNVLLQLQQQKKELIEKNLALEKADLQIKQLNADLQKNIQNLRQANEDLESFSYSVSHDLRAPLRIINGYTKMMEEDYHDILDDEGKRLLEGVYKNAIRMDTLIDDLLAFSRFGRQEINKTRVEMTTLTENILGDLNKTMHHQAEVKIQPLHTVLADPSLIRQVMINLLSNAIKYSAKSEKPVVEIKSAKKDSELIYSISDNGAGFNMKYADKLFAVFQRLHKAEDFEGTGVGLAIVHRIISRHDGKVWAEGEIGKGATFHFSLPA